MAKTTQGNPGKKKISLAPVKTLSDTPATPEPVAPVPATPKPVVTAPVAAAPPKSVVSAPVVSAPVIPAPVVAPVVPVAAVPAPVKPAAPVAAKPAAPAPEIAKIEIARVEVAKPAPVAPVAVATEPKPVAAPAPVIVKTPVAAAVKPAKVQPAPVLSLATIPTHPGMTDFDAESWFAPALNAFRALAAVQGKVLDHACAELKAALTEAEALARAKSPSEAVALQGKAFSRRLDASSAHIADLATTVRTTGKAA